MTIIELGAFEKCSSLTSITIPDGVTIIESVAFRYCSSLTSVTIGNGVTSIGSQAFRGCTSLNVFCNFATTPQPIENRVFEGISKKAILYVPDESLDEYKSGDWGQGGYFSQILPLSEYDPTSIEDVYEQKHSVLHGEGIYTIGGVRRTSLQKGLNIVNGKKILMK